MDIKYRSRYFDDPEARASFKSYAKAVFGLDFSLWEDRGLWDAQYQAFSAFAGGDCIASMCVYPCEAMVNRKRQKWAQLLTVGTLPEYRGQGIQRKLWKMARTWISKHCMFTFLFAEEDSAGFYESLGFEKVRERFDVIANPGALPATGAHFRKVDVEDDGEFAILKRLARERAPVSDVLSFKCPNLLLFMFLYPYREMTYYSEDLDAIVVAEKAAGRLRIHDIVARKLPRFDDIKAFLGGFPEREIALLFPSDKLGVEPIKTGSVDDSILFVNGEMPLKGDIIFPYSIRA
jgi:ribosomal protein S18 acetylase RimI-like enzyme